LLKEICMHNLISISQLCDANFKVLFTKTQGTIFNQNQEVVLIAPRRRDVYVIDMTSYNEESNACFFVKASLTCKKGKLHKASFKTKRSFSINKCLHLLYMDLFGHVKPQSISHNKYTLVIVDEYSRYTWVFCLKKKSDAADCIISFIRKMENLNEVKTTETSPTPLTLLQITNPLAPQDRWSRDKHIELVNIIGEPLGGITTRSRNRDSKAASAHECLYVNFLSEIKPKKLNETIKEEGWVIAMQEELN
ncbi:retrovirus-related pol polyprotein from transposon TNT 1-94, partial [Tanacetum coccineum]